MIDERIDHGTAFDWGKTSREYARWRDIYPQAFYEMILRRGLCRDGQKVLDVGTGTGVLPRRLYPYGACWIGADSSPEQIEQAKRLSEGMNIDYVALPTEELSFPDASFDVITACQCFWYFRPEIAAPKLAGFLKPGGTLLVLYMAWLPFEDAIAGQSEALVLRYHPQWTGGGETMHPIGIPPEYETYFELVYHEEFPLPVHFTRESWHGRMKACRGVGASLSGEKRKQWEEEHLRLMQQVPEEFDVLHYAAMAQLKKRSDGRGDENVPDPVSER